MQTQNLPYLVYFIIFIIKKRQTTLEIQNLEEKVLSEFSNKKIFFSSQTRDEDTNLFISDSVTFVTGYSVSEVLSFPELYHSLIIDSDLSLFRESITKFEKDSSKNCTEIDYRIFTRSKDIKWIHEIIDVDRNKENGIIISKKSTCVDVTSLKINEELLIKSKEELVEINSSKDKFISIISHDLRAPFTTLLGFSEILLNEKDISEEEKNEYIQYIYESSKNQLSMINCLLDWSRLQTGRVKIEPERLNVRTVISNVIAQLTGEAVRKNIDLKIDIPPDLYMNADDRLINQALMHLINNGIKYSNEGKNVLISASKFKEGMIEIIIKDEGVGISEENHHKLFKIDQKFSLPGTSGEKGSGLGLTLVKEIIEKHGSDIWFYSQVGEGTEFHFTVHEAKNLILIVEEKQNIQDDYKRMLSAISNHYELRFAKNGYDAISIYKSVLPSIIIIDHVMPLMNGIQFVEAINKKENNKPVPIIVTIADYSDTLNDRYESLGINSLIVKPLNDDFLLQTVKQLLN
jgi:signal transduction histidine kinase